MRITILLIIAMLLVMGMPVVSLAAPPLTLANIETLLRSKVSSKRVAQLVDERKVATSLTAASTRKLLKLGAGESLISAIRKNSVASLQVESAPPGAEVFLNGRYKGKSPLFLERVEPGMYELQLGGIEGHQEYREDLVLPPGELAKKSVTLKSRPEQPAAEEVAAKDRERKPPVPAAHPVRTQPPHAGQATARPVEEPTKRPADERRLVPVSVGTEPVSAHIYLDGKYIAASPADFLVAEGKHRLRLVPVQNPEYETLEKEILVRVDALNAHLLRLTSK